MHSSNSSESDDPFKDPTAFPDLHVDGLNTAIASDSEQPTGDSPAASAVSLSTLRHQRPHHSTPPPPESSTSHLGEDHLGGSTPSTGNPISVAMTSASLVLPSTTGKRRARARKSPNALPCAGLSAATATDKRQLKQRLPLTETEALELRRKYNRESMQRTRAREREEVERMRAVLAQLELEYKRAVSLQTHQERDPMRAKYHALSSTTRQLMQENFSMRQDLEHRRKSYERVERILTDYHAEKADMSADTAMLVDKEKEEGRSTSAAFDIPLITEDEAFALIAKCSQQTIESLERHACKSPTTPPLRLDAPFFGWDVRRRIDDGIASSSVHFLFTKRFPKLSAARASNSAWRVYGYLERNNVKPIRVVRFETLQVVNENSHVIARDIIHPRHEGAVLRSIFLRFRMETKKGFVIGRSCMNPVSPQSWNEMISDTGDGSDINSVRSNGTSVRYVDLSTWLEVNYLDPLRRDEVGCEVKFGGVCDYGTTHDLNARFMDVLFSVLQMENRVLEPLVSLPK